jgi:glycosyltransferase involved in cell wall biosynthesis
MDLKYINISDFINYILNKKIIIFLKNVLFIHLIYFAFVRHYNYFDIKNIKSNNFNDSLIIINDLNYHMFYSYINYIKSCRSLKRFNNKKIINNNKYPFLSICISAYNSEKYIEQSILSILNQSFQDFEIIIINDFSNDHTSNIINRLQSEDIRIKIINHNKNLGTYHSRVEGVLNSNGKYILFVDPDDMLLNPFLFDILFHYNINLNLDIIEFTAYNTIERKKKIFIPNEHYLSHNHNYKETIIYQPKLSNILFHIPSSSNYTKIFCRTLWSKLYRKYVLLESIKYIGNDYYNNYYIIIAEDTLLNIINFQFANNYTNIYLPGYLYNIRKNSISHTKGNKKKIIIFSINAYLYLKLFLKYVKEFDKDINYFYYELKELSHYLINFKIYNINDYLEKTLNMLNFIINYNKSTEEIKNFSNFLLLNLKN